MNCQHCGAPLAQGVYSCSQCGALNHPQSAPGTNPAAAVQPAQQAYPPPAQGQQAYPPPAQGTPVQVAAPQPVGQAAAAPAAAYPPPTPQQMAQYQAAPYGATIQPAAVGPALAENPLRAIYLAGVLLALMFLSTFFVFSRDEVFMSYVLYLSYGAIACGAYLITKPGALAKVSAGVIAVLAPLFYVLCFASFRVYSMALEINPFLVFGSADAGYMLSTLVQNFILGVLVIGAALGGSLLSKNRSRGASVMVALCSGVAVLIAALLTSFIPPIAPITYILVVNLIGRIPAALAVGLAVFLVHMLCNMKSYNLAAGVGHKVWFGICLGFSILGFVVSGLGSVIGTAYFQHMSFMVALLTLGGIIGYLHLLMSKRLGYLIILLSVGVLFFGEFSYLFTRILIGLTGIGGPMVTYLESMVTILPTLVNPTITGIVVLFIWKKLPAAKPYSKPAVSILFKIFAIAAAVLGAALFFVGSTEFFNLFTVNRMGTLPSISFLCGVFFGATTLTLGVYSLLACFRKESRAPLPLFIASAAAAALSVVFLLIIVIT